VSSPRQCLVIQTCFTVIIKSHFFFVLDGIRSNKSFLEMEYEFFVRETKQHLRNAKSRFDSAKMDPQSDEDTDDH
jgi:hypothetical protein